ncbi:MAG: radical SAM protein [Candidatus Lokiarchaeota archaeon]|nr:radical SAM protein [Candidatus Lokiarchaeota archaeon]
MSNIQEINVIRKKHYASEFITFALCYPNKYRAGISNYAIQLIYTLLNRYNDISCERIFWDNQKTIKSIESGKPLNSFDYIGFTLQYELDYFNIIKMLKNGTIPILSRNRRRPILVAGGPCVLENPIPIKDIFDLLILGDLEPELDEFVKFLRRSKANNYEVNIKKGEGFLIPHNREKTQVEKSYTKDLNSQKHVIGQIIPINYPNEDLLGFGKSLLLECTRGCKGKCNFCLIGWQNNPYRERSFSKIKDIVDDCIELNPIKKISIIGSGISFHKKLNEIAWHIANKGYNLSVPSLRADKFTSDLAEALNNANLKQITFAPETGSNRLRSSINKKMTNNEILNAIQIALENNIKKIKLYFMIDLPGEKKVDIKDIPHLIDNILEINTDNRNISISINPFIPKPHTPFQWSKISDIKDIKKKMKYLRYELEKQRRLKISFGDPRWSRIQTILSRGDKEIQDFLLQTYDEGRNLGSLRRILSEMNLSLNDFLEEIDMNEKLPWDFINTGIKKKILVKIWKKYRKNI